GAGGMADWLETREQGFWQALAAYAARPSGDLEALAALMQQAGDPDARLCWLPAGEVRETPASSHPAPVLLAADLANGRLELRGRLLDPALGACFALAVGDLAAAGSPRAVGVATAFSSGPSPAVSAAAAQASQPSPASPPVAEPLARRPSGRPPVTSLIRSSPALRAAVARLARLA